MNLPGDGSAISDNGRTQSCYSYRRLPQQDSSNDAANASAGGVLAVIPARGGSKGLPGKNVRPLAGLPLIAHSIRFAALCPEITRCIVSTDDEEIAAAARRYGGDVPFLRPAELARDETPALPVLQHACRETEKADGRRYEFVLLLQPTNPAREPGDVTRALEILRNDAHAAGVVSVSEPSFNPRSVCVEEKNHYLHRAFPGPAHERRQDAPRMLRINGVLYLFRRDYLMAASKLFAEGDLYRSLEIPDERGIDIDTLRDLQLAEVFIREGMVRLPWLNKGGKARA
jgi:N-acylneuraminate cytidylyltransferase